MKLRVRPLFSNNLLQIIYKSIAADETRLTVAIEGVEDVSNQ
jgi:hypothetical protein